MPHSLGTPVKQRVQPVTGRIVDTQWSKSHERLEQLVESHDGTKSVWMPADDLEVDEQQQAKDQATDETKPVVKGEAA